ncbi:hypothetical protein McpSp1_07160 [Methanocorpusculaceae archaeon Sp1]|uniref:Archaeal Type IV pilin N-terminal domain-containing protein n=2 Tax=Methanorbis furvi TaxID=3028299 RepID=A0AAE4MCN3_9EURY|nr:hypothetical protein [Methanocorpusculaceae archaeon Sp1]MDV0442450.1 hypothetical protein [Methanocorpusculaceae archaeon Ag1]
MDFADPLGFSHVNIMASKNTSFTPAMGVVLVIAVIGLLVGSGLFVMENIMTEVQTTRDVQINLVLSGDDIVVTVLPGDDAAFLRYVTIYVDGSDSFSDAERTKSASISVPIVYESIAHGVTGTRFVMVKGTFSDGKDEILKQIRIQFS